MSFADKLKNQISTDHKGHCLVANELDGGRIHYRCHRAGVNNHSYYSQQMSPVAESLSTTPFPSISTSHKAKITVNFDHQQRNRT